MKNIDKFYLS